MAAQFGHIRHEQLKCIRYGEMAVQLEVCPTDRQIVDGAVDPAGIEQNRSGLEYLVTFVVSMIHRPRPCFYAPQGHGID